MLSTINNDTTQTHATISRPSNQDYLLIFSWKRIYPICYDYIQTMWGRLLKLLISKTSISTLPQTFFCNVQNNFLHSKSIFWSPLKIILKKMNSAYDFGSFNRCGIVKNGWMCFQKSCVTHENLFCNKHLDSSAKKNTQTILACFRNRNDLLYDSPFMFYFVFQFGKKAIQKPFLFKWIRYKSTFCLHLKLSSTEIRGIKNWFYRKSHVFAILNPLETFNKHIINMLKAVNKRKCFIVYKLISLFDCTFLGIIISISW